MSNYLKDFTLMKKVWRYLTTQIQSDKPNAQQLSYIIEPLCCIIKLAILSFNPEGTKICIQHNTIEFSQPNILQGTLRWSSGDKREDLHHLHNPLVKAAEWYPPLFNQNKSFIKLFNYAIDGLKLLKTSYSATTIICHSLDRYIDILDKSIQNRNDLIEQSVLIRDVDENKILTRSMKNRLIMQNKQEELDNKDMNSSLSSNEYRKQNYSLSTQDSEESSEDNVIKQTTILGKQLKNIWTIDKIDIILKLFIELEKDIENKDYYLSAISKIIIVVENKVTDILYNVNTYSDS